MTDTLNQLAPIKLKSKTVYTGKFDTKFQAITFDLDDYLSLKQEIDDKLFKLKGIEINFVSIYHFNNAQGEKKYYFKLGDYNVVKGQFTVGLSSQIDFDTGLCQATKDDQKYFEQGNYDLNEFVRLNQIIQYLKEQQDTFRAVAIYCDGMTTQQLGKIQPGYQQYKKSEEIQKKQKKY